MRLNWFSPLPPASSPAAMYSARVLPFLKGRADVLLWTPQPLWDRGLDRWANVRSFSDDRLPWEEINLGDATLFHLGSGTAEDRLILDVLSDHAGLVTLHIPSVAFDKWQRCLGLVVHDRDSFTDLKAAQRWPVLFLHVPWAEGSSHALTAYKEHVESLLTFADESRRFTQRLTAEDLALKTAKEMTLWTSQPERAPELPRTVHEIVALTSRSTVEPADRRPLAA